MALSEQFIEPGRNWAKTDIHRAAAGRRSRELGDMFEEWVLRGCEWYWEKGVAYIEKNPEPMRPIKIYGDRRRG